MLTVIWTDYFKHRARLRGFDLATVEQKEDILHLVIAEEDEANSIELSPNITAELNEKGELIGIEILNASTFVRDTIMEGVQAKVLQLTPGGK